MAATAITAVPFRTERHCFCFPQGKLRDGMSRFKPHIALLICNIVWAMAYPFYNIVLPRYVHPMAMVSGLELNRPMREPEMVRQRTVPTAMMAALRMRVIW